MKDRLYNNQVKLEYMETQIKDKGTRITALHEFLKIAEIEKELNKDISNFNDIEIANTLKIMRRSNVLSIRKTLSILNDYVQWCIINGKRGKLENNINYVSLFIKTETNLNKYVSNRQLYNKILNKEEFEDLLSVPVNASDQAILLCLYEFIGGEELYELRSLEMKNINKETNTVKLLNKNGETRISKISDRLIKLLEDVDDPDMQMYIQNNGEEDARGWVVEKAYAESHYIFKTTKHGDNDHQMMPYSSVLNRLKMIKNFIDYKHITANSIRETRIIHEVLELTAQKGLYEPTDDVYDEVANMLKIEYDINLSHMQLYNIKQKLTQITNIKDFN